VKIGRRRKSWKKSLRWRRRVERREAEEMMVRGERRENSVIQAVMEEKCNLRKDKRSRIRGK
jgi:hypothetical protein